MRQKLMRGGIKKSDVCESVYIYMHIYINHAFVCSCIYVYTGFEMTDRFS